MYTIEQSNANLMPLKQDHALHLELTAGADLLYRGMPVEIDSNGEAIPATAANTAIGVVDKVGAHDEKVTIATTFLAVVKGVLKSGASPGDKQTSDGVAVAGGVTYPEFENVAAAQMVHAIVIEGAGVGAVGKVGIIPAYQLNP